MLPTTTGVLVVGAGPTGLTAAISLVSRGHEVTVVDNQAAGDNTSRAAVVHSLTLEALEPHGVAERLAALGVHAPRFTIRDRDRVLVPVPFDNLPTAYPYTLMISQAMTERVLLERLIKLGGTVHRPYTLTTLDHDDTGVAATFSNGSQTRAAYVVGADGMHSTVREQAGIGFGGETYAESFTLADVRLSGGAPHDEVILYFSPAGMVVVAPLPDGIHRIVATVDEAPQMPDADFLQHLLDTRGPQATRAQVRDVIWGSRFRVHHRVADTYRQGRILLAGDAAHVHSPAGGQGMNTGITDAVALGTILDRVLRGGSAQQLDDYGAARRPIALQVVKLADRLTRLATVRRAMRPLRNAVLGTLGRIPPFRRRLARRLSGLVYR
ncbi:FAD-dependent oxidoreductase [Actinobacteria bacterium YIM 96077]|uniref:Pentachlorophenol monooxygenase n=1 Tax=Phytoactinopolyspora halophila TaxID=1981511 RepID=A0A329QC66_9ACTN|nr:FAD-dependent oxidoreductase [Phytoactinopolyspora halophila]AYY14118.1 FAD-dependent oxidoreductase [Actinobacteria bacterium YIM 96077]RAW09946.1 pentachlorophenol monooxygenase [Phytoactinopolyspora halophila]